VTDPDISTARLAHSPESAARRICVPVRAIYSAIAAGELRSFKMGRRRLIPDVELQRLMEKKMADEARRGMTAR
jgi:excisionase family DNA binding protein